MTIIQLYLNNRNYMLTKVLYIYSQFSSRHSVQVSEFFQLAVDIKFSLRASQHHTCLWGKAHPVSSPVHQPAATQRHDSNQSLPVLLEINTRIL